MFNNNYIRLNKGIRHHLYLIDNILTINYSYNGKSYSQNLNLQNYILSSQILNFYVDEVLNLANSSKLLRIKDKLIIK